MSINTQKYTFPKKERLCSKPIINRLFADGLFFKSRPFHIIWTKTALPYKDVPAQLVISVPKRRFKLAVDRNKIKRRIREVYRKNKHHLFSDIREENIQIAFILIYTGNKIPSYEIIEKKLPEILQELSNAILIKN